MASGLRVTSRPARTHLHARRATKLLCLKMGKIIGCSPGPEPFPGIPIREPFQQQQTGEVLIRYELETVNGCTLNLLGWCCFGALCCVAPPLSWLPFMCDGCKMKCQRPVYGYELGFMTTAQDSAWLAHKAAALQGRSSSSPAPPRVLCMDASLLEQPELVAPADQHQQCQQQRAVGDRRMQALQMQPLRCTPSPPPVSIFVPPSAVPAYGFTPDNPFPSRYSPAALSSHSPRVPMLGGGLFMGAQQPPSPRPGTGLSCSGLGSDAHQRQQELAHSQRHAAAAAAAAGAAAAAQPAPLVHLHHARVQAVEE